MTVTELKNILEKLESNGYGDSTLSYGKWHKMDESYFYVGTSTYCDVLYKIKEQE